MKNIYYVNTSLGGWQERHKRYVRGCFGLLSANFPRPGAQVVRSIDEWCSYAIAHQERFESKIGDDYVLGPAWARWGFALRELLNGDMGAADCGTLDTILCDNLTEQGFNPDEGAP